MRDRLLHLGKKDFKIDTFRAGGPGGQHQNKRDSGVRITHKESGVSAESREERSQRQNRIKAFRRLTSDARFKAWVSAKIAGVDRAVQESMSTENLLVEIWDGKEWKEWDYGD